ncbi:MAG TPA: SnoaL-like domain-containing protein [Dokdonella sp.]
MDTAAVAARLVELCRSREHERAQKELYAEDAVSIEMEGLPAGMPTVTKGLSAIFAKGRRFDEGLEAVHGGSVGDPIVAGQWFALVMTLDATLKGRGRVNMQEICVYHVRDGKIDREQFFYDVG